MKSHSLEKEAANTVADTSVTLGRWRQVDQAAVGIDL